MFSVSMSAGSDIIDKAEYLLFIYFLFAPSLEEVNLV